MRPLPRWLVCMEEWAAVVWGQEGVGGQSVVSSH